MTIDPRVSLVEGSRLFVRTAAEQGGVISGDNPTVYNSSDPFRLWAIQIVLIIATSRICLGLFYKMRQPRVVAEIMGGIILGPTLLGRIPGFSATIFPVESIPLLQLCATIGLVFFLFIAALEIDMRGMRSHMKASVAISISGLVLPAGFGAILATILYPQFSDASVNFGHFLLFIVVSVSITAFPILCRMLTELNLFDTSIGVVVITAGVGNDVVGWVLLALTVSLTNSKSNLTALWILLTCIGYTAFCWYPVRLGYRWIAMRTGSLESGEPSSLMITLAIVMVLVNAFFTDIIGLHAIFGGFLSGLLIPHENDFSKRLVYRMEDIVLNIFLPVYFTLSGLKTDLGLLNTGKAWGYTIIVCLFAYFGKSIGCGITARFLGFSTRDSCAIGTLMTCKGLLELIVLNLGLQAGIMSTQLFAMFVVHAMILTFSITPLTAVILRTRHSATHGVAPSSAGTDVGDTKSEDLDMGSPVVLRVPAVIVEV